MAGKKLDSLQANPLFKKRLPLLIIFSIFFNLQPALVLGQSTPEHISAEYIYGWENPQGFTQGAIKFQLAIGWKTYWRNPGQYGVRPIFNWQNSINVKDVIFSWPTPKVIDEYDVKVLGYKHFLIVPVKIVKSNPSEKAVLNIDISIGVCSNICLLKKLNIDAVVTEVILKSSVDIIEIALAATPKELSINDTKMVTCSIETNENSISAKYKLRFSNILIPDPIFIMEYSTDNTRLEDQRIKITGNIITAEGSLNQISQNYGIIERDRLRGTFMHNNKSFEVIGCN
jgi:DsbC/DsbD-like thiol-disulfide interchange protein